MDIIQAITSVMREDSYVNVMLGLGGEKDPSAYTTFSSRPALSDTVLEALYTEDPFAARIVEAKPREAMRPGWDLSVPGAPGDAAQVRDAFAVYEQSLDVRGDMGQGAAWGRLFGGAVTWVGAEDGRASSEPLNEGAIAAVRFLHTYDRRDVRIAGYYDDPLHANYGLPNAYVLNARTPNGGGAGSVIVHESRVVRWSGQPTTDSRRTFLSGWDDSVIERCWDALKAAGENYGALGLMLGRVSQAVYKIKGLYAMIAGKQESLLRTRMSMLDTSRSRARAIALDTEEDFVNVSTPLGGAELLVNAGVLRLAAAASMPYLVLMGQAGAGIATTGSAEMELWYAEVESWRELELRAAHERIARLILLAKNGPTKGTEPETWQIVYRPLRMPTAMERALLRKALAEVDAIEIDKGIIPPEAVALARHTGMGVSEVVMLDDAEAIAALARRRELASAPPKDNAELGTVGPRAGGGQMDICERVATGRISRESGKQILIQTFRLTDELAEAMLGPVGFVSAPTGPEGQGAPAQGFGAGAPQPQPGQDQGGRPKAGE